MDTLAERLAYALDRAGKTQADLVRATGAASPSVSNWVNGRTKNLKGRNLVIAAQVLNVSEAWLANGVGPMSRKSLHEGWPFSMVSADEFYKLDQQMQDQVESLFAAAVKGYLHMENRGSNKKLPHIAERLNLGQNPSVALESETSALLNNGEGNDAKRARPSYRGKH